MGEQVVTSASRGFRFVRFLVRLMLRSQFRRREVEGAERVPDEGAVLLVANHNSSLVDPMALLDASPRPASFLAKAPLWNAKLLAPFLDAVGAIPVYRPQDESENAGRTARANIETFRRCRARLAAGGSIALFPEGVSQPQPSILPLRTGAARIALDAGVPVTVCPVGLVYFPGDYGRRGGLLVRFGEPIVVDGWQAFGSRRAAITTVTRKVEASLKGLVAEAASQGELAELRAMRLVWQQESGMGPARTLLESHRRDQQFAKALARLREERPRELSRLRAEADAWVRALNLAELSPGRIGRRYDRAHVLRYLLTRGLPALLLLPLTLLASILTWPVRRLGDVLALRVFGGTEDLRALCRMIGGGFILVLLMLAGGMISAVLGNWWLVILFLIGLPLLLAFHIAWRDRNRDTLAGLRAYFLLAGSQLHATLLEHRHSIYERLLAARDTLADVADTAKTADEVTESE